MPAPRGNSGSRRDSYCGMLSLDDRAGSGELERYFTPYGIKVNKCRLEYGDLAWEGNGPNGDCMIVVERKRITDLIQSMESKRLSGHQLPGMAEMYDYCYLIVEGMWRPGKDGELEICNGTWSRGHGRPLQYRALDSYLMTLELKAGVIYRRTVTPQETVAMIVGAYRWWREKKWDEHESHRAVYAPANGGRGRRMTFRPRKISTAERICMQLPGIDSKAKDVAAHFGSVERMMAASVKEWTGAPGVGKVGAKRIWEALRT
jgi:ERCC4-type nuclease